ncbi:hypothetical protein EPO17_02160 [Patescibacteria group bacterium]|nr:MAG: hypothetical protein EPO17_02160 [Patescibacteria group bacterium]
MKPLLKRGRVFASGTKLQQYDEHAEDEAKLGNTGDFATNLMTIAEFRLAADCEEAARIINLAYEQSLSNAKPQKRRPQTRKRK